MREVLGQLNAYRQGLQGYMLYETSAIRLYPLRRELAKLRLMIDTIERGDHQSFWFEEKLSRMGQEESNRIKDNVKL